jgi:hypothetical protein
MDEAMDAITRCDELTASDDHISHVWSRCALARVRESRADYAGARHDCRVSLRNCAMTARASARAVFGLVAIHPLSCLDERVRPYDHPAADGSYG